MRLPDYFELFITSLRAANRLMRTIIRSIIEIGMIEIRWLLYGISGFIPRDKMLWLFGTIRNGFSDNAQHLFIYVSLYRPDIRAVWISGNKDIVSKIENLGFCAVRRNSATGFWLALRAKYYFFTHYISDINFFTSRGSILVNLWHGSPLKKIEFDVDCGPSARRCMAPTWRDRYLYCPEVYVRPSFVLSASRFVSEYALSSAFRLPVSQCLELGYPRLDLLITHQSEVLRWLDMVGDAPTTYWYSRLSEFDRVILYLPTWRDSGADVLAAYGIDFETINQLCSARNSVFAIKLHPFAVPSGYSEFFRKWSHIILLPTNVEPYALMSIADVLVTDYSSVMFEFILTRRPIVLHAFDLENFVNLERTFYHLFEEIAIGQVTKSAEELNCAIEELLTDYPRQNYEDAVINRYNTFVEGGACERISKFFLGLSI